jgi:hypothetical protein
MTYTDRIMLHLEEQGDNFTLDEIRDHLNQFQKAELDRKNEQHDIVPVGKYRYKKVKDVANFDKEYLKWMLKQEWVNKYSGFVTECNKYM